MYILYNYNHTFHLFYRNMSWMPVLFEVVLRTASRKVNLVQIIKHIYQIIMKKSLLQKIM